MYEIQTDQTTPENLFAGDFPIVRDTGTIKDAETVRKYAPIILTEGGIKEPTSEDLDDLIGIAAADPSGDQVSYYLTGEFFAAALVLPAGVTADALKPAFRKIGIFLK